MPEMAVTRPMRPVLSVAQLIGSVAALVENRFAACSVRGEISGFLRAGSGHCYFNLKDPGAGVTLRCAMFRRAAQLSGFDGREGDAVELRGRLVVYEPRGELQFVVESVQRSGAGALYERFIRLRAKLEGEGLFAPGSKRPLPSFAARIGVVTSLAGAALHDVVTTLARRSPHVHLIVYPSLVQGAEAPLTLCNAVAVAAARAEVDILIVCRGGGSLEDLWAFNEESVVRAIRASPMPVVSGVGHETDVTLADLAADVRAATPTAAAELVALPTVAAYEALLGHSTTLTRRVHAGLDTAAQRLDRHALRLSRPSESVRRRLHGLDLLAQRLDSAFQQTVASRRSRSDAAGARIASALALAASRLAHRLDGSAARLAAVDPRTVLGRGYALLADRSGRPVTTVAGMFIGQPLVVTLNDGEADLTVSSSRPRAVPCGPST